MSLYKQINHRRFYRFQDTDKYQLFCGKFSNFCFFEKLKKTTNQISFQRYSKKI